MRHRILTCKNHPNLRRSTKDCAWTDGKGYNGSRNIFFTGTPSGHGMHDDQSRLSTTPFWPDGSIVEECACNTSDLVLAPEDAQVTR
jgi:hypothetical protein